MPLIYKICPAPLWREAERAGRFAGSADDRRDGFIHFSAADQVTGTAAKHFAGQSDLLLVSVNADRLGAALKWEPSRGGDPFPHLYGALALDSVVAIEPLPLDSEGRPVLPPLDR